MTDDTDRTFPGATDRPTWRRTMTSPRQRGRSRHRTTTARREANPLTREGPDAPDAADIEDPDEQL